MFFAVLDKNREKRAHEYPLNIIYMSKVSRAMLAMTEKKELTNRK